MSATKKGFTIVELLVAIVIIGILGTLALVSYAGILDRTYIARIKSDFSANDKKLKAYTAKYGSFPTSFDSSNCPATPTADKNYCLTTSGTDTIAGYIPSSTGYSLIMRPSPTDKPWQGDNNNPPSVLPDPVPNPPSAPSSTSTYFDSFAIVLDSGGSDSSSGIIKTSNGTLAVIGDFDQYYSPTGDFPPCSAGGCLGQGYAAIMNIGANGSLNWAKRWDGSSQEDTSSNIIQLADGSYVMVGTAHTSGIFNNNALLIKINSDGSMAWNKLIDSGSTSQLGYSVIQSSDGGFLVSGTTSSGVFVAKFDSSGNFSSTGSTYLSGISGKSLLAKATDNGYVLAGQNFLIKFNSSNSVVWSKQWTNSTNITYASSISQTSDGGYIYGGATTTYGSGNSDAYLIKFTSTGDISWSRTWGGAANDAGYGVIQTRDGGYLLTGYTASYGGGNSDAFIAKFDSTGNLSWSRTWGDNSFESGWAVTEMADGGFGLVGDTDKYDSTGDVFVARYDMSGYITNCPTTLCRSVTATSTSPSFSSSTLSPTITTPFTLTIPTDPTGAYNSISPTLNYVAQ